MNQWLLRAALGCCLTSAAGISGQTVIIDGAGTGRSFDGVGGVSGGGATSVLLMSYPEPQRSEILDLLFKPNFGASITTHFCEVPGDCNSTQGSEPSHMHAASDENYQRGYEWWLMNEAYKRNPDITFDAVAWGCPGWVGNGSFWSVDMQNYYIKWIQGLKSNYGITLDAVGCRNESGHNYDWAIQFREALDKAGFNGVRLHGFDNWSATEKWEVADAFASNTALRDAIDVVSAHTTANTSWSETKVDATEAAKNCGKPLWDTEEHYMQQNSGFNQATAEVNAFNSNYIRSRVTKTLFWYLICSTYPLEPWNNYGCAIAQEPWSGHYVIKEGLWGFAHYNQFVKVGWNFVDGACGNLSGGGTYVTLKSPDNANFSVIIETKAVAAAQTVSFVVSGGLPTDKPLCVWRSNSSAQFVRQDDIIPEDGAFLITVNGNSIYSISTTTGQQNGSFPDIPASRPFPLPYHENYDHYSDPKLWGYMPYYHADICGVFELSDRPDGTGTCLRQVLQKKAQSWAPEWAPYTIIGDRGWKDYEVSADVYFDNGGWAGVMARINSVGTGYGCPPRGYYLRLESTGAWGLYFATASSGAGTSLADGTVTLEGEWTNIKLRCSATTITGFIGDNQVCSVTSSNAAMGMAGLCTGDYTTARNSAMFDNLVITSAEGAAPEPTLFPQDSNPPYDSSVGVRSRAGKPSRGVPGPAIFKFIGNRFSIPEQYTGKKVTIVVYDLNGTMVKKLTGTIRTMDLRAAPGGSCAVRIALIRGRK